MRGLRCRIPWVPVVIERTAASNGAAHYEPFSSPLETERDVANATRDETADFVRRDKGRDRIADDEPNRTNRRASKRRRSSILTPQLPCKAKLMTGGLDRRPRLDLGPPAAAEADCARIGGRRHRVGDVLASVPLAPA